MRVVQGISFCITLASLLGSCLFFTTPWATRILHREPAKRAHRLLNTTRASAASSASGGRRFVTERAWRRHSVGVCARLELRRRQGARTRSGWWPLPAGGAQHLAGDGPAVRNSSSGARGAEVMAGALPGLVARAVTGSSGRERTAPADKRMRPYRAGRHLWFFRRTWSGTRPGRAREMRKSPVVMQKGFFWRGAYRMTGIAGWLARPGACGPSLALPSCGSSRLWLVGEAALIGAGCRSSGRAVSWPVT